MSRNISFAPEEYYHCFSRGVDKRKIFLDTSDYQRFILLLFVCNSKDVIHLSDFSQKPTEDIFQIVRGPSLVSIGAYCLMPNHFHFLIKESEEKNLSRFMQKLMTAYTMYFNKKYQRSGSLFGSKFKAEHCATDRHLKYIFSYIHLNPVKLIDKTWREEGIKNKGKVVGFLRTYSYSSYKDFLGEEREQGNILDRGAFPDYFPNKKSFEREISDWISFVKVRP